MRRARCGSDSYALPETQSAKAPHWFFKFRQQPGGEVGFVISADERKQRRGSGRVDGRGENANLWKIINHTHLVRQSASQCRRSPEPSR